MTRPLIGITTYGRDGDGRFHLPAAYVDCVRWAGGVPLLLPPGESDVDRLLSVLDGLILAGGGDVDPAAYGCAPHETVYSIDAERDEHEIHIARRIVDTGLPTLGICRGCQVLNVALGGTLHPHLPDVVGDHVLHRLPPREPTLHGVRLESGSSLEGLLGAASFSAVSWHHQAIRDVAPPLRAVARAPDGTIEAVEMPSHPWLYALQWHPELASRDDAVQRRVFAALVAAAASRKRETAKDMA